MKLPEENPTVGLILCKSAEKTVVGLTLPKDANIHAKEPERSGDRLPRAARTATNARSLPLDQQQSWRHSLVGTLVQLQC